MKLFEIQEDKLNLNSELKELKKDRKIKDEDKEKIADLKEILEKRAKPKIGRKKDEKSNLVRYIREDIQDKIDDEWETGWDYLQRLEIPIYQDDGGSDGILVHINNLPMYERGDNIINSTNSKPQIKLSFFHLSDVQLRDERVYMFRKELTDFLDLFTDGFSHHPNLVGYDHSYYLNLIGVMKLLNKKLGEEQPVPSFMIHTGDVAHMGVVSEHYEFLYITNELTIPWYNVLGNHDYPVYGNLSSKDVGVIDPNMGFQTLSCRYNFINMHGMGFEIDPNVYFSPINAPHDSTWEAKKSVYNGFDMKGAKSVVAGNKEKPCKECPGGKTCKECPDGKPCTECPDGKYCGKCSDR
ncbi:MAG: metallophosphoesterase, partial [Desulfobacterales bacterium]